ncbi:xanthine dehydrogenase accessory protein XdhC [Marinobacterium aestuarii]|uniref:Xanthine dehydrogenase accessory protein XdhC n=1 Tax=Marinobacterium aestuarii TaxID=1821621 RepID=A0A1A9F344_9GAMM|nr:xanthine dehydrogenase accessory protein XdhC [Marinobacterium aestuarii]ANG64734.1 xanthine dehydrogenase accessory protein XdhC [Marinobacterium aestuarii]
MNRVDWISALNKLRDRGESCVLVTILDERGSTPRNNGTKMVVTAQKSYETIGGGHLEHKAMQIARRMLSDGDTEVRLEKFSLGASLGQCCGGATSLLFEPVLQSGVQIALFGAGHVARALVNLLATLPCRVRWIDSRDNEFPAQIPDNVEKVVSEFPTDEVDDLPAHSYCIVLTHNHQLDLELSERILKRGDFDYFGLIGSRTKRKRFEHRLRAKGMDDALLARMICPMGTPEVKGKLPAEIAIAIAGEVIAHYNADFGAQKKHAKAPQALSICRPA